MNLTIYTKEGCCYCDYTKKLCDKRNINYTLKDSSEFVKEDESVKITFPRIVNNGEMIGGYTELVEYLKPTMDYIKLKDLAKVLTYNLNKIIDYNYYPTT